MPRNAFKPGMFDELSPAEQLVEAGAPRDMQRQSVDLDSNGEAIRPWHPQAEEPIEGAPKITVEDDDDLEFSMGYSRTAGGKSPNFRKPFGRWEKE